MKTLILLFLLPSLLFAEIISVYNPIAKDNQPAEMICGRNRTPGVVYLHGWLQTYLHNRATNFRQQAATYGWSFIAPNFRDRGLIEIGGYDKAIEDIRQSILVLKRNCGANEIFLFGTSGGGFMAFNFANKYPHLIDKLATTGAIGNLNKWQQFLINNNRYPQFVTESKKLQASTGQSFSPVNVSNIKNMPIHLTHAKDDLVVPFSMSKDIFKKLNNAEFVRKETGGHSIFIIPAVKFFRR